MKKIFSLIMIVFILFTGLNIVYATDNNGCISIDECAIAAQKWIKANELVGTEIESIIPIKNLYEQLNGYCITFIRNEIPSGYIVINASKFSSSYIREFSFDGNGIFQQLCENSSIRKNVEKTIYSTRPYEYAIKYIVDGNSFFYNSDSSVRKYAEEIEVYGEFNSYPSELDLTSNNIDTLYEFFFYGSTLTNYTTSNNKVITGASSFMPYVMSNLRNGSNTGNCGPTAATNICAYYNSIGLNNILKNNSINDTYSSLVTAVGFDPNGSEGTYYSNLKSGLRSYIQGRSYNVIVNSYLFNLWNDFKRDFDNNLPNLIYVQGYLDNNGSSTGGHFVVGIGYRILNDGSRYIRVYDGWNATSGRFLYFDSNSILDFKGASVSVGY